MKLATSITAKATEAGRSRSCEAIPSNRWAICSVNEIKQAADAEQRDGGIVLLGLYLQAGGGRHKRERDYNDVVEITQRLLVGNSVALQWKPHNQISFTEGVSFKTSASGQWSPTQVTSVGSQLKTFVAVLFPALDGEETVTERAVTP
ncbi:hypothetical protein RRG08_032536 [Elysia crispata]|uniref:Uncharacterized protein n=1 Tax=Elysia crispata TaxID=231223 RepID=A0AAE1DPY0_9GAST|nr:hypothetical protein RRG08_032536 [Elysia crispata]